MELDRFLRDDHHLLSKCESSHNVITCLARIMCFCTFRLVLLSQLKQIQVHLMMRLRSAVGMRCILILMIPAQHSGIELVHECQVIETVMFQLIILKLSSQDQEI